MESALTLILLLTLLPRLSMVHSQGQGRFPGASRCLGMSSANTSDCINCSVTVSVSPRPKGSDCSSPMMTGGAGGVGLNGRVCSELEDVLESIARSETTHQRDSCIRVFLRPKSGGEAYVVQAREGRRIDKNVVFTGLEQVSNFLHAGFIATFYHDLLNCL